MTGRPVVFIPTHGLFDTLGRHIVVAWNSAAPRPERSTTHYLIERAERVTVLAVNPADFVTGTAHFLQNIWLST